MDKIKRQGNKIMDKSKSTGNKTRREFLKGAGVASVAGGAAVAATATDSAKAKSTEKSNSVGYRETEHVKTYYELTRF